MILFFGGNGPKTLPGWVVSKRPRRHRVASPQWAVELGEHGIRVVTLQTGEIPEFIPDPVTGMDEIIAAIEEKSLLNRAATLADVGDVASFVASDRARTTTATEINISCGALMD